MAEEHSDWFFRGGAGALVVPAVFDPRAVDAHARRVHNYVARGGPFVSRGGLLGYASGGWTVQDWLSDAALKPLADMLHGSAALHDALRRLLAGQQHRRLASLTYGAADNAFSDAYDRAFRWRNAFFNNESLRSSCGEIRCRKHTVLQEVKSAPPSELLTQLLLEPRLRRSALALQTPSQAPPTLAGAMSGPSSPSAPQRAGPRELPIGPGSG